MYRKIISDGDLVTLHKPWYGLFTHQWEPHRNLSEEARLLKEHREKARAKYIELAQLCVIANKNVGDDLETLQILLLDNSEAYFETSTDGSILEQREGTRYNFGSNNKNGSSSNKENQQKKKQQPQSRKKTESFLSMLARAQVTVH